MTAIETRAASPALPVRSRKSQRFRRWRGFVLPLSLLAAWFAASATGVFSAQVLPSPQTVLRDLWRLSSSGQLFGHVAITTWRVALGFLSGTAVATVLGAATGYSARTREFLDPTIQARSNDLGADEAAGARLHPYAASPPSFTP